MSHNNDTLFALDDTAQGMCFHTRLDAGISLYLLGFAAEVSDLFAFAQHDLVAAASQREINRHTGIFIILAVGRTGVTDTDT